MMKSLSDVAFSSCDGGRRLMETRRRENDIENILGTKKIISMIFYEMTINYLYYDYDSRNLPPHSTSLPPPHTSWLSAQLLAE